MHTRARANTPCIYAEKESYDIKDLLLDCTNTRSRYIYSGRDAVRSYYSNSFQFCH